MDSRFYFDIFDSNLFGRTTLPGRLVVHNINDTTISPDQLVVGCEISTNGNSGLLGNWQRAQAIQQPMMLKKALEKLVDQQYASKRAFRQMHYREDQSLVVDAGPYEASVSLKPYTIHESKKGIVQRWYLSSFILWNSATNEKMEVSVDELQSHQHLMRGAIVRLLRSDAKLKKALRLKPSAPFDAVEKRLNRLGENYRLCEQALDESGCSSWRNDDIIL